MQGTARQESQRFLVFLKNLLLLTNRQCRACPETGADLFLTNDFFTINWVPWGVVCGTAVGDVTVLPLPRAGSPVTCCLLHECSCWIPVDTEESRLGANQTLWNEAAHSFFLPQPKALPDILHILCEANCPFSRETPPNSAAVVSAIQYVHPRTRQGKWRAFLQQTLKKLNKPSPLFYFHFALNGHPFYWLAPVCSLKSQPVQAMCKLRNGCSSVHYCKKPLPHQEGSSSRATLLSSWNLKQNHDRAQSKWNLGQPFAMTPEHLEANVHGAEHHCPAGFWTNSSVKRDLHYRLCPDLWSVTTAVLLLGNSKLWMK